MRERKIFKKIVRYFLKINDENKSIIAIKTLESNTIKQIEPHSNKTVEPHARNKT